MDCNDLVMNKILIFTQDITIKIITTVPNRVQVHTSHFPIIARVDLLPLNVKVINNPTLITEPVNRIFPK